MPLRRDAWFEWDDDEACSLAVMYWTSDTDSLVTAIRETGWLSSGWEAFQAAEEAEIVHTWCGHLDGALVMCNADGSTGTGDVEGTPEQVTVATIPQKFCTDVG